MANTSSAKKAIRVQKRRAVVNSRRKNAYKDAKKDLKKAVIDKDKKKAHALLPKVAKAIDKAAKSNVIHKNTAARYKSRLSTMVKSLG